LVAAFFRPAIDVSVGAIVCGFIAPTPGTNVPPIDRMRPSRITVTVMSVFAMSRPL